MFGNIKKNTDRTNNALADMREYLDKQKVGASVPIKKVKVKVVKNPDTNNTLVKKTVVPAKVKTRDSLPTQPKSSGKGITNYKDWIAAGKPAN